MTESTPQEQPAQVQAPEPPKCLFPGCERPVRKPSSSGPGAKPKYCDTVDESGKPVHTALTKLRAEKASRTTGPARPDDFDRAVTMATATAAELYDGIRRDMDAFAGKLARIVDQL